MYNSTNGLYTLCKNDNFFFIYENIITKGNIYNNICQIIHDSKKYSLALKNEKIIYIFGDLTNHLKYLPESDQVSSKKEKWM